MLLLSLVDLMGWEEYKQKTNKQTHIVELKIKSPHTKKNQQIDEKESHQESSRESERESEVERKENGK